MAWGIMWKTFVSLLFAMSLNLTILCMDRFAIPKIKPKPGGRNLNVLATYAFEMHFNA